jgi:anti-sigma factor RsiW
MTHKLERAELQDRLPDYVQGTLAAGERAQIEAALATDAELASELELVRAVRGALAWQAAPIDADAIVAALPHPVAPRTGLTRLARLRVAAAIATIAVGGASLAVVQHSIRGDTADSLVVRGETTLAVTGPGLAVSFGYDLSMLDEADLEELLADLEHSAGLPPAEPRRTTTTQESQEGES